MVEAQIAGAGATDLIVGVVFGFFYLRSRSEHLRLWALAFVAAAARQTIALVAVLEQSRYVYDVAIRLLVVVSGVLLMKGTYEFLERRLPSIWYLGAGLIAVWIVAGPLLGVSFLLATLPAFFFRTGTDLVTGLALLQRRRGGMGAVLAGVAFVLWGLHRANYPLLRPLEWAAPWGFAVASVLGVAVAIGVLTMHYERAREDLVDSEAKFRSMFEHALDGYIRTDPEGNILAANPALVEMLGYDSEEELRQHNMVELYAEPRQREAFIEAHQDDGVLEGEEVRWRRRNGDVITAKLRGKRVYTRDGDPIFEGSVHDVTAERLMQEQLELARRMESLGRLAGGVAHDFNNVLTSVLAGVELAEQALAEGDDPSEDLEVVRLSAMQGADLSGRLLDFSRPDAQEKISRRLDDIVEGAMTVLRRVIPASIRLVVDTDAGNACVSAEAGQLERVLTNLVINAQNAIGETGTITVETSTAATADRVQVSIQDDGAGMDEATLARIFEPFYTTRSLGRGTGLGLANVFNVVRALDGSIDVESTPGEGTEFRIDLPTCEAPAVVPRSRVPEIERTPLPGDDGAPLVVLVEDEEMVRRIVKRTLESVGFKTLAAVDGEEGLELVREHLEEVELVVSDVVMPGMSGPEMIDALREERPDLPFLLLSGYTADKLEDRGVDPVHFLEKPFSKGQLLDKIHALHPDGLESDTPGGTTE